MRRLLWGAALGIAALLAVWVAVTAVRHERPHGKRHASTVRISGMSSRPGERLLLLEGTSLRRLERDRVSDKWQQTPAYSLHAVSPDPRMISIAPVFRFGEPLVAVVKLTSPTSRREPATVSFFGMRGRRFYHQTTLTIGLDYLVSKVGPGVSPTLAGWVPGEGLVVLALPGTEMMARWVLGSLGPGGSRAAISLDDPEHQLGLAPNSIIGAIAYSIDGRWAVLGDGRDIILWDRRRRQVHKVLTGVGYLWSVAFSADGRTLAWLAAESVDAEDDESHSDEEYIPVVNKVGTYALDEQGRVDYPLEGRYKFPTSEVPAEWNSRVLVTSDRSSVFFLLQDRVGYAVMHLDLRTRQMRRIGRGVTTIAIETAESSEDQTNATLP